MKIYLIFMMMLASAAPKISAAAPPTPSQVQDCKVVQTLRPVYPLRLLNDGVTHGEARIALQVDPTGQLTDTLVIAYSHRGFADEALRVVPQWKFVPAQIDGRPAGSVIEVEFTFRMNDIVSIERKPPKEEPDLDAGQYQYKPATLKQLDRIPTPVHVEPPYYPKQWADRGLKGRVTVEFYIDETGRARMPAVVEADDHLLAGAAIAAIGTWQFEPPTENGRPVLVRAQQTFTFGSE